MTLQQMWEKLEEMGVSEQTLQIVTDINGYNEETMKDILYAHVGYRSLINYKMRNGNGSNKEEN